MIFIDKDSQLKHNQLPPSILKILPSSNIAQHIPLLLSADTTSVSIQKQVFLLPLTLAQFPSFLCNNISVLNSYRSSCDFTCHLSASGQGVGKSRQSQSIMVRSAKLAGTRSGVFTLQTHQTLLLLNPVLSFPSRNGKFSFQVLNFFYPRAPGNLYVSVWAWRADHRAARCPMSPDKVSLA